MQTTIATFNIEGTDYWDIQEQTTARLNVLLGGVDHAAHIESMTTNVEEGEVGIVNERKVVKTWVAEVTVKLKNMEKTE